MAHRSRFIGAAAATFAFGVLIALPTFSSGAAVKNDLRSFEAAKPRVVHTAPDLKTEPPLHGTEPHGQGTVGVVDLNPSNQRPFSGDPLGGDAPQQEDVVIGRSRGERRADGTYRGTVTVAALFGNELIPGASTGPGDAPVDRDILASLLGALCTGPGPGTGICLEGVHVKSQTTTTGSTNSFQLLRATIGGVQGLPTTAGIDVRVASSEGNISTTDTCQTTHGASNVANVAIGAVTASAATSSSDTVACRGAGTSQNNESQVVNFGAVGVPLPAAGCGDGTADTVTNLVLIAIVCNADDSSNTAPAALRQADAGPYGVRNALDVYVLATATNALLQLSTAQAESHSVAPAAAPTTTTTTPTTTTTTTTTSTTPTATTTTPVVTTPLPTATTPATTTDTGDDGDADNAGAGNQGGDTGDDGAAQCEDGVDNDGDGVIDAADPGCHTDGNANNPASYNPNDDSEVNNGGARLGGAELPFTGTDVVALGLAGSILLAAGLTLRGPARRRRVGA